MTTLCVEIETAAAALCARYTRDLGATLDAARAVPLSIPA